MKEIKGDTELPNNLDVLKQAALVSRFLNHKLRQDIMQLIQRKVKIVVTEIYTKLKLEQSVASQHLAILRNAGFVKAEQYSKLIYQRVSTIVHDKISLKHIFTFSAAITQT